MRDPIEIEHSLDADLIKNDTESEDNYSEDQFEEESKSRS